MRRISVKPGVGTKGDLAGVPLRILHPTTGQPLPTERYTMVPLTTEVHRAILCGDLLEGDVELEEQE